MLRTLSGILSLVIFLNLSLTAVASSEEMQTVALQRMRPEEKLKIARMADRLGDRIAALPEQKQRRLNARLLRLVERAESRVTAMSDRQLAKRIARTQQEVAEPADPSDMRDAQEISGVFNAAARPSHEPPPSSFEKEASAERFDRVLSSLSGNTPRERLLSATDRLKQGLSEQVAKNGLVDRSVAASGDLIIALFFFFPILIGIIVGLAAGALLIPILAGLALNAIWIFGIIIPSAAGGWYGC